MRRVGAATVGVGVFGCILVPSMPHLAAGADPKVALFFLVAVAMALGFLAGSVILPDRRSSRAGVLSSGSGRHEPWNLLSGKHGIFFLLLFLTAFAGSYAFRRLTLPASPLPSLIWGGFVLSSITGLGALVRRGISGGGTTCNWAEDAALGMAVLVVAGGLLNLGWMISAVSIHLLLAVGFARFGTEYFRIPRLRNLRIEPGMLLWIPVAAALLFQLAAAGGGTIDTVYRNPAFDMHDDEQAYLVFPEKMLQIGSMGPEPFEARRMLSMGGQSFLHAVILSGLPLRAVHIFDMGIAPIIAFGLMLVFGKRRGFDHRLILFSGLLVLAVPHLKMRGNTTALFGGVVLMMAWFLLITESENSPPRVIALTAAALCALKSTFIPAAAMIFLFSVITEKPAAMKRHAHILALIGLFDLPWMISILSSSDTLLYPIFGRGYYGGVFTNDFSGISGGRASTALDVCRSAWRHLMPLMPSALLLVFLPVRRRNQGAYAVFFAAVLSVITVVAMGDPNIHRSISRYVFPAVTASFLVLILSTLAEDTKNTRKNALGPAMIAALVVGLGWMMLQRDLIEKNWNRTLFQFSRAAAGADWIAPERRRVVDLLQESLPEKGTLLATLRDPALLDFTRRKIFIMSLPGMSMLPPGMPISDGGEAVAEYLLDHDIPLLAYGALDDSSRLLALSEDNIRNRYPDSKMRWALLRYHQRYHKVVKQLVRTRKSLYNDGRTVALDLRKKCRNYPPESGHVEGLYHDVWTTEATVFRDLLRTPKQKYLILRTRGWRPKDLHSAVPVLRVTNGENMEFIKAGPDAFLYRIPEKINHFDLEILAPFFDPIEYDAAPSQPMTGFAFEGLEIVEDPSVLDIPTGSLYQDINENLDPASVWTRKGFFKDFNWTDGDARIDGIHWSVSNGCRLLVIRLHPVHPWGTSTGMGLRVFVNGIELSSDSVSGQDHRFRLYRGLTSIESLRLRSKTFKPSERSGGNDTRDLGVPIKSIFLQ